MEIIKKLDYEIKELNTNFLLNLENYARTYYNTLIAPQNKVNHDLLARKNGRLNTIDQTGLLLKNKMNNLINKMSKQLDEMNINIAKLKKENIKLTRESKMLHKDALTADGLFDGELDWYRDQVKIVVVMVIGVIIGFVFYKKLNLTLKDHIISIAIVLVFGYLFSAIYNFILNR